MSGFVATAPATAPALISTGDWYPSIDPTVARGVIRMDGTVTDERLVESLSMAMLAVEDQLDAWQQQQVELGRAALADVPSKQVDGVSRLVLLYRRAVYATAQAELTEAYRTFSATAAGERRADAQEPTVDDCRRNVRYAIRDILGRPRGDAELI